MLRLRICLLNPMPMSQPSGPKKRLSFTQFDVFTSSPLDGNPLAVFPDATGLSDDQMQAIAREMNLSETTFVFPRDAAVEKERGIRVRIYTVQEELPFAGHPTLGTAFALRGSSGAAEIRLELNVGTIPVRFEDPPGQPAFGEMTQIDPVFGMVMTARRSPRSPGSRLMTSPLMFRYRRSRPEFPSPFFPCETSRPRADSESIRSAPQSILPRLGANSFSASPAKPLILLPVCTRACCFTTARTRLPALLRDAPQPGWWNTASQNPMSA